MPSLAQSVYNRPANGPNIPSQEMASLDMGSQIKLSPAKCHIFCTEIETLNPGSRDTGCPINTWVHESEKTKSWYILKKGRGVMASTSHGVKKKFRFVLFFANSKN